MRRFLDRQSSVWMIAMWTIWFSAGLLTVIGGKSTPEAYRLVWFGMFLVVSISHFGFLYMVTHMDESLTEGMVLNDEDFIG